IDKQNIGLRMCQITKNDSTIAFWEFDAVFSKKPFCHQGFFAVNGERFLSFLRCHPPPQPGRRWLFGVADSSFGLKSEMPQH
ncbi:MAG: hypothetical protein SO048_09480, partial [Sodaliphilus sp.]|nr:hypothetical protein [Sodaliphilus sp.]